ncbi:glycine cleavage system aminomethyltransferase GcvT [Halobellus ruber]|uniref:Probable aminomethyltransferase n=1 Tax=Halobellus ruber TaxID=2761102 RepID=A0A7J9SDM0_9EURY|nr:glycine cleavage system aminomethyltransferase GcvT [Halobellus ruber]MBB6645014.1 glycine cleavage system aminomethyltransferase GcvT [Halobellus ruber]
MALRQPPLYDLHADRATFTDFGGWEMPVEFDSIRTEHAAVRESVGIFDVSHMGEVVVDGPDATELMQRLLTADMASLDPGDAQYAAITDEAGIIHDDTIAYRLPDDGDPRYLFVPNAGHDEEAYGRWVDRREEWGLDCEVRNETDAWAMVAVQGPDAPDAVADATTVDPADLGRNEIAAGAVDGVESWIARTGYTGEDGVEILCPPEDAAAVWSAFEGCQPCGLGSRDTLRTEMGFLLSGQDFDPDAEPRTPYEAGIGWAVDLDTGFVGRDALAEAAETGPEEAFVGLKLRERGIARHGHDITVDGEVVGHVTSGTMSPTLGEPIALGYVPTSLSEPGTQVEVVVRGDGKRAEVASTPFIRDK